MPHYIILPVVHLQQCKVSLCCDLPFLILCWVWVLWERNSVSVLSHNHFNIWKIKLVIFNKFDPTFVYFDWIFSIHNCMTRLYWQLTHSVVGLQMKLLWLTMRCWNSQERMMLVACFGRTPLLFLHFLSSLSNRDDKSTFTLFKIERKRRNIWRKGQPKRMARLSLCCHGNKGRLPITYLFSVARAETPPQVSPW